LLQHGAAKVWAIDVGSDQLDWKIRSDPRVSVREKLNARYLVPEDLEGERVDLIVVDVSFISLTLILKPALAVLKPAGVLVPLIKPQFELKRKEVGKGGVVRETELHQAAVNKIQRHCQEELGIFWENVIESPIRGGEGNMEFLACLRLSHPGPPLP
jgi:23S rRNA (cytidine1920-2'-O)/16S rRNA (cytidine1409-2'-O)-methyltransferase